MKTKLVVYNEYCLGFIMPSLPNNVQVLRDSILKGAVFSVNRSDYHINPSDTVRLATEQDFEDYRVVLCKEYRNKEEYKIILK